MSDIQSLQNQLNESREQLEKAKVQAAAELIQRTIEAEATRQGAHAPRHIPKFIDGKPMVRENDNGEQYVFVVLDDGTAISVSDAVAQCRGANGNLFSPPKPAPAPVAQQIDVSRLSHAQYRELRQSNPQAVGLSPRYIKRRGR